MDNEIMYINESVKSRTNQNVHQLQDPTYNIQVSGPESLFSTSCL